MPWHWEPKKDVTSCEKPRVGANIRDPRISEWGNPAVVMRRHPQVKKIVCERGTGELKHLSSP